MTSPTSAAPSSPPPKVAILFSLALEGERNMCRGILDYAKAHGPWRCHLVEGRPDEQLLNLKREGFDGIISAGGSRETNAAYAAVGAPFVLLEPRPEMRATDSSAAIPYITRDSRAIGALAASYYLKRGYRSFAFVGEPNGAYWSEERRAGFMETLEKEMSAQNETEKPSSETTSKPADSCSHSSTDNTFEPPQYCPHCGKKLFP